MRFTVCRHLSERGRKTISKRLLTSPSHCHLFCLSLPTCSNTQIREEDVLRDRQRVHINFVFPFSRSSSRIQWDPHMERTHTENEGQSNPDVKAASLLTDEQLKYLVIFGGVAGLVLLVMMQAACMIWRDKKNSKNLNKVSLLSLFPLPLTFSTDLIRRRESPATGKTTPEMATITLPTFHHHLMIRMQSLD